MEFSKDFIKEAVADSKALRETALINARKQLAEAFEPKIRAAISDQIGKEVDEMPIDPIDAEFEGIQDLATDMPVDTEGLPVGEQPEEMEQESLGISDEDVDMLLKELEGDEEEMPKDAEPEAELAAPEDSPISADDLAGDEFGGDQEIDLDNQQLDVNVDDATAPEADEVDDFDFEIEMDDEGGETQEITVEPGETVTLKINAVPEGEEAPENDIDMGDDEEVITLDDEEPVKEEGVQTFSDDDEIISLEELANDLASNEQEDQKYKLELEEANKNLADAYNVIEELRAKINEVALLNAKLLFTNKLFKYGLNEQQMVRIVNSFNKAESLRECKLIYNTLNESLKNKQVLKEKKETTLLERAGVQSAARPTRTTNERTLLKETAETQDDIQYILPPEVVDKLQRLAKIKQ
jgi:hypothetical protein